jgi:hypothetical protein
MIDPDKLRALHEAAKTAGPGTKRFRASLLKSELVARADEIIAMAEENARMRADAARYRWLRDHSCPPHNFYISVPDEFSGVRYGPSEVDAYIDAARRALGEGKA